MFQDAAITSSKQVEDGPGASRLASFWDGLGILMCLVVAFCATLFPARNQDLFLHLAAGQQLATGTYDFSKDPFVYTNPNGYVNHNWFFSIVFYLLHQIPTLGPSLLIIIKALGAVAAVALVAKSVRLPLGRLTIPILALGLMSLGISHRWLLQPFALSVLFFSLTLYLLSHLEPEEAAQAQPRSFAFYCLPALFILWVNCDIWFLFGPLAVTVFCIARMISGNSKLSALSLGILVALSWAACLVNPWGFNAFQVPLNIRFYDDTLKGWRDLYPQWFCGAISQAYLLPHVGFNLTGLAFFPLAVLGLIFAISGRSAKWMGYVGVFFVFLVLGLAFSRTLPFFCVAAAWATLGLCLSQGSAPASRPSRSLGSPNGARPTDRLVFPKVGLCFLLTLALIFAIPGWIHPRQVVEDRSFGLGIIPDESLKNLALWVKEKKNAGEWDESKQIFHLSMDLTGYLAWYAPGTKGFIDYRLTQDRKAANDYYQMRTSLQPSRSQPGAEQFKLADWKEILHSWNVGYVVFQEGLGHENESVALTNLVTRDRRNLSILRVEGTTFTVALKSPALNDKPPAEDPKSLAFGAEATKLADAPEFKEPAFSIWKALFSDTMRYSAKDFEARLRLTQFLMGEKRAPFDWVNCQIAAMAISASSPQAMANPATWTAICGTSMGDGFNPVGELVQYLGLQMIEDADPAYLYLCIRAARQSLLAQPNDPKALFFLGQAYQQLNHQSLERLHFQPGNGTTPMAMIRSFQLLGALNKASKHAQLTADQMALHELLMENYGQRFPEVTLAHMKQYLDIILGRLLGSQDSPQFNGSVKQFVEWIQTMPMAEVEKLSPELKMVKRLLTNLANLEKEVRNRQDKFENAAAAVEKTSPNFSALQKALMAFRELGLIETARDNIDTPQSREQISLDPSRRLLRETTKLNLEILLNLGEIDAASEALIEEYRDQLDVFPGFNVPAYQWFNVLIAAAQGRYQVADAFIKECIQQMLQRRDGCASNIRDIVFGFPKKDQFTRFTPVEMTALCYADYAMRGTTLIQGQTSLLSLSHDFRLGRPVFELGIREQVLVQLQGYFLANYLLGELELCRGFLSLESGDVQSAKQAFEKSLGYSPAGPSNLILRKFLAKMP